MKSTPSSKAPAIAYYGYSGTLGKNTYWIYSGQSKYFKGKDGKKRKYYLIQRVHKVGDVYFIDCEDGRKQETKANIAWVPAYTIEKIGSRYLIGYSYMNNKYYNRNNYTKTMIKLLEQKYDIWKSGGTVMSCKKKWQLGYIAS